MREKKKTAKDRSKITRCKIRGTLTWEMAQYVFNQLTKCLLHSVIFHISTSQLQLSHYESNRTFVLDVSKMNTSLSIIFEDSNFLLSFWKLTSSPIQTLTAVKSVTQLPQTRKLNDNNTTQKVSFSVSFRIMAKKTNK